LLIFTLIYQLSPIKLLKLPIFLNVLKLAWPASKILTSVFFQKYKKESKEEKNINEEEYGENVRKDILRCFSKPFMF